MRARMTVALLVAVATMLTGCGGGSGGGAGTTLVGVVVDDGTLRLVIGATVSVGGVTTTTGTTGQFTLTGVARGAQVLTVTQAQHERVDVPVNIGAGQNQAGTVYLPPVKDGGRGHITGIVTDAGGVRIGGANVGGGGATSISRSDGTGVFTLYNVILGSVQVTVNVPATGASAWRTVTVSPGQTVNAGTMIVSLGPPPPPI